VLERIEPGRPVSVEREVFPRLIGDGLYARVDGGRWRDIGTPDSYLAANLERMPAGGMVDPSARIDPTADVTESVIGPRARIAERARIHRSVVLQDAEVAPGSAFEQAVVGRDGRAVW
jgi:mannose-1-phosphate guanylyltransferase